MAASARPRRRRRAAPPRAGRTGCSRAAPTARSSCRRRRRARRPRRRGGVRGRVPGAMGRLYPRAVEPEYRPRRVRLARAGRSVIAAAVAVAAAGGRPRRRPVTGAPARGRPPREGTAARFFGVVRRRPDAWTRRAPSSARCGGSVRSQRATSASSAVAMQLRSPRRSRRRGHDAHELRPTWTASSARPPRAGLRRAARRRSRHARAGRRRDPSPSASPPLTSRPTGPSCARSSRRYGPQRDALEARSAPSARRPIRTWQVWSEPNLKWFWSAEPWAERYVELLRAGRARAARRADPRRADHARRAAQPQLAGRSRRSTTRARGGSSTRPRSTPTPRLVPNVMRLVRRARRVMDAPRRPRRAAGRSRSSAGPGRRPGDAEPGLGAPRSGARRRSCRPSSGSMVAQRRTLRLAPRRLVHVALRRPSGEQDSFQYAGLRRQTARGAVSKPALRTLRTTLRRLTR